MRVFLLFIVFLLSCPSLARAQEHLLPDTDFLIEFTPSIKVMLRQVFARALDDDRVLLRVVVAPSMGPREHVMGLREQGRGFEAFVAEPSSWIFETWLIEAYETGEFTEVGRDGKPLPLDQVEEYQELKKRVPSDPAMIKLHWWTRPIPNELADQLREVWKEELLKVRRPETNPLGADGTEYYCSAYVLEWGNISGHVQSPDPETRMHRFVELAESLGDYARGTSDLDKVRTKLMEFRGR